MVNFKEVRFTALNRMEKDLDLQSQNIQAQSTILSHGI